jgi:hypothetical protein
MTLWRRSGARAPAGPVALVAPAAPQLPQSPSMTFFVTGAGPGKGGVLGGLEGADRHCQQLAERHGAGGKTWRAYLSTQAAEGKPAINARDHIGTGPWQNFKGEIVAQNLDTEQLGRGAALLLRHHARPPRARPPPGSCALPPEAAARAQRARGGPSSRSGARSRPQVQGSAEHRLAIGPAAAARWSCHDVSMLRAWA